jgi:DNA-binding YbaB/EbfC family protein
MSPPDIGDILSKAQQMQGRLAELQRELATRRFEGSAGGGMVTAIASGELRVLEIRIEPKLVADGDRDMIQDLCAAAVNAALANAQRGAQEEMQRLTGALGIPGLGGLGFGGS